MGVPSPGVEGVESPDRPQQRCCGGGWEVCFVPWANSPAGARHFLVANLIWQRPCRGRSCQSEHLP